MPRPVHHINLSPRENIHVKLPNPWWFALGVLLLGVLIFVNLILLMVG